MLGSEEITTGKFLWSLPVVYRKVNKGPKLGRSQVGRPKMLTLAFCPGFPWTQPHMCGGWVLHADLWEQSRELSTLPVEAKARPPQRSSFLPKWLPLSNQLLSCSPWSKGRVFFTAYAHRAELPVFRSQSPLLLAVKMHSDQEFSLFPSGFRWLSAMCPDHAIPGTEMNACVCFHNARIY